MNPQTDNNEMLAVIHSDVKKLIKRFKLDRRKQNGEDADSDSVPEPGNEILQNIAAAIKEISERKLFTDEQIDSLNRIITGIGEYFHKGNDERQTELKALMEIIIKRLDEQQATAPQTTTVRREHYFTVDFKNSKAALTMTAMAIMIIVSLCFNIHQADKNSDLRDNDIKYRYIKMYGKASAEEVYRLETIFEYNRNNDSVKMVRRQVEHFEQLLKEYNEKQAQIRQNDARAREIEQETTTVKGNK